MEIEKACTPADFKAIDELAQIIWTEHYTPIIGKNQVDYMLEKFQSAAAMQKQVDDGYAYFMLKENSRLIGYLAFKEENEELFLSKIYVEASLRGKGYGRKALHFLEEQAREKHLKAIRLTVNKYNTKSIDAYLKMGFERTRALVMDIGSGFVMDDYEMKKPV